MAINLSRLQRWAKRLVGAVVVRKRTEITIETQQVLTIKRRLARVWCQECGCDVEIVDMAEAEALAGVAQPRLPDGAPPRRWHLLEGENGTTRVCLESVRKSI